jgi:hypothetical protein
MDSGSAASWLLSRESVWRQCAHRVTCFFVFLSTIPFPFFEDRLRQAQIENFDLAEFEQFSGDGGEAQATKVEFFRAGALGFRDAAARFRQSLRRPDGVCRLFRLPSILAIGARQGHEAPL